MRGPSESCVTSKRWGKTEQEGVLELEPSPSEPVTVTASSCLAAGQKPRPSLFLGVQPAGAGWRVGGHAARGKTQLLTSSLVGTAPSTPCQIPGSQQTIKTPP